MHYYSNNSLSLAVTEVLDNVFLLEECPHDWLFPQCFAVVSFTLCFAKANFWMWVNVINEL